MTSTTIIRAIASEQASSTACRVGFTVSGACGNAVTRNRIKRRLRAAVAKLWPDQAQAGFDYVLIGRAGAETAEYQTLVHELSKALAKLHG